MLSVVIRYSDSNTMRKSVSPWAVTNNEKAYVFNAHHQFDVVRQLILLPEFAAERGVVLI